ncbi:MAG: hypothetical protein E7020_07190 [Alphaproteobacteria bacterium]|nr:hypothetical protein [Alphaproteobacteria bacterium]
MGKDYKEKGVKYIAAAGSLVAFTVDDMLKIAKCEDAFCYTDINGTPLVVEPEMSFDEAIQSLRDVRAGKMKIAVYDTINDFSVGDVVKGMEKLAKKNDFVISTVNGTTFRIKKDMTAKNALDTIENIRQNEFLQYKQEEKHYSPELTAIIKDEVFEPHDSELWKSLNSNRITGYHMDEVEVYGRVMSHLMKEQKQTKPNAEMLEETLDILRKNTKWVVPESNDNLSVGYLIATWKHGEELAHSMKDGDWMVDYYRNDLEKYREKPVQPISKGRGGIE